MITNTRVNQLKCKVIVESLAHELEKEVNEFYTECVSADMKIESISFSTCINQYGANYTVLINYYEHYSNE